MQQQPFSRDQLQLLAEKSAPAEYLPWFTTELAALSDADVILLQRGLVEGRCPHAQFEEIAAQPLPVGTIRREVFGYHDKVTFYRQYAPGTRMLGPCLVPSRPKISEAVVVPEACPPGSFPTAVVVAKGALELECGTRSASTQWRFDW